MYYTTFTMPNTTNKLDIMDIDKYPEVMKLKPAYRQILVYLLSGCSNKETAERMGLCQQTISRMRIDHDDFIAAFNMLTILKMDTTIDYTAKIKMGFEVISIEAKEKMAFLMRNQVEDEDGNITKLDIPYNTQLKAAEDILAYGIGKPADKIEMTSDTRHDIVIHDDNYSPYEDQYFKNHPEKDKILKEEEERVAKELAGLEVELETNA